MKNCLFIVTESESANGICCKALISQMQKCGNRVFFITNQEYGQDRRYFFNEALFYTVKPRLVYRLTSFIRHDSLPKKVSKMLSLIALVINKVKLLISYPTWPLISPLYSRRIYKIAKKLIKEHRVDTIIPIYTQIDTLIAANKIKRDNPDISYIPYFLDSLSGGYGPKVFSKEWTIRRGLKWEKRLLPNADRIIMMQSSKEHYEKYCSSFAYYGKIAFLDLPLFAPGQVLGNDTKWKFEENTVNLLFVGTIPAHIRPIEYFIELFSSLPNENLRLTIIGSSTCEFYLEEASRKDKRIVLHPFVNHDEAIDAMRAADILVNFGNNNEHMTPSKIFEYMSFGKPIISTAPIVNEPSLKYLELYPVKHVVSYENNINDELKALKEFIDKKYTALVDIQELENKFYLNTPKAFFDVVR